MVRRRTFLSVCALALLVSGAPAQTPPDAASAAAPRSEADRVLDAWEARVKGLASFKCRFRQEKKVSFMRRPLVSTGTIAYRDRRLLWVTESPAPGFLALDATEVRIYTPEFKTLEIYPLGARSPAAPSGAEGGGASTALTGAFPGFSGDFTQLRADYSLELLPPPAGSPTPSKESGLRLIPRREELKKELTLVDITLDASSTVKAWRMVRANGDELALTVSDFEANAKVSDAELTFETPADVKVVRPLAGGGGK